MRRSREVGIRRDLDSINLGIVANEAVRARRGDAERRGEQARARAADQAAARQVARDERAATVRGSLLTPLTSSQRTALIVVAVVAGLTGIGLPVTVVLVVMLVRRSPSAVARRRAELGLNDAVTEDLHRPRQQ